MGGVEAVQPGQPQPGRPRQQGGPVEGVGLQHEERVEQLPAASGFLDVAEAQVMMVEQGVLLGSQPAQEVGNGLRRIEDDTDGDRGDEHPDHVLRTGEIRRPTSDGGAEHHVVAAGRTAEQNPPGGLQQRVEGAPVLAGEARQPRGQRGLGAAFDGFRWRTAGRVVALPRALAGRTGGATGEQGRFGDALERPCPRRPRGLPVLSGEPP